MHNFTLINYDKCKVLHTDKIDNKSFEYTLNDNYLKISEQEKDSGVLIANTLLWKPCPRYFHRFE